MAKGGSGCNNNKGDGGGGKKRSHKESSNWSAADHADRLSARNKTTQQLDRTKILSHDTLEKRNGMKLKLHLAQTKRHVAAMRQRLQQWDPVVETEKRRKLDAELEQQQQQQQENNNHSSESVPKKKRGRKGPETWKLRGAARPAHEVYDFDTRYVDPYIQAHTDAKAKSQRLQNLTNPKLFDAELIPECREYLGLLMQLGHISEEAKQYKTAREAWLECIDLEGTNQKGGEPLTTAREALMRLYVKLTRYEDAYQYGVQQLRHDSSVWVRYHAALVACILGKDDRHEVMTDAVKSNVFCAFYLAYYEDVFSKVMEYTEDLEDTELGAQSSFEEAIEYCGNGEDSAIGLWCKTEVALQSLRTILHNKDSLSPLDLDWDGRLNRIQDEYEKNGSEGFDVVMFAGQFRTAMEMIGEFE